MNPPFTLSEAARLIELVGLDRPRAVEFREMWVGIVRLAAAFDPDRHRRIMGYPADLPDLSQHEVYACGAPIMVSTAVTITARGRSRVSKRLTIPSRSQEPREAARRPHRAAAHPDTGQSCPSNWVIVTISPACALPIRAANNPSSLWSMIPSTAHPEYMSIAAR